MGRGPIFRLWGSREDEAMLRDKLTALLQPVIAGLGYDLYHVHLERNANTPEEDVIHMRHRAYVAEVTWSF